VARHWFDDDDPQWTPKCTLVLHRNVQSYRAAVGRLADCTVASCKIDAVGTTTTERRIDARADHPQWLDFLPHELTHLLLDGRLTLGTLPRWADEGMALVADPDGKRVAHQRDLRTALARGQQFRMVELLALSDYPRDDRLAAFYGQSLSVVQFLIDRGGRQKFVEFVGSATVDGYEAALRASYGIGSIADLERQWLKQVGTAIEQQTSVSSDETAPTIYDSAPSTVEERKQSAQRDSARWRRRLRVTRSTARGGMGRS